MEAISVQYTEANARHLLKQSLLYHLEPISLHQEIIVLCIGTDRSTGDSLGPMIGSNLVKRQPHMITVYGTLDDPVHALNLAETITLIRNNHTLPFIIAVDACLGRLHNVGMINIKAGPVKPGAGVKKELPEVGDLHITGNVNVGGFMEYFVLQNTRLSIVVKMAEVIADSLSEAIAEHQRMKLQSYRRAFSYEQEPLRFSYQRSSLRG